MRATRLEFAPPCLGEEEIAAVVATLRSGWLATGERVERFEREFAERIGAEAAVAVSSCTAGLFASLSAHGIGRGDAVITTPMTFAATLHAIEQTDAQPLLADVDADTLLISVDRVVEAIDVARRGGIRVRAILPVHFAGHPADLEPLEYQGRDQMLALVEDAAHALPARAHHRTVGAGTASLTSFSFHANKNITTGDGGMVTGPRDLVERVRRFTRQGLVRDPSVRSRYDVVGPGWNLAMNDVAAAIGLAQIEKLRGFHERRCAIALRYDRALAEVPAVETPSVRPGILPSGHAWHLYVVKLRLAELTIDRDRFVAELDARRIGTSVHYRAAHTLTHFRERWGWRPEDFPVALAAGQRVMSLPIHPAMTDADADDVVAAVADVVRKFRR